MRRIKEYLNNKNIIRAMLAGYLAAFVFVLFAFGVKSVPQEETAEEKAVEESVSRKNFNYSRPVSSLKEIKAEEDTEEFVPAPDKLNLAYFFPEDADTSDSINSYAGRIYTAMNSRNAEYFASYFDLTDRTPLSIASQYGLGSSRVMGKYNPNDASQSADNPSSWTVNSFRNVNVSFYDGDGNRISGYYNAQEIMALASVYAYYHEMDDYEAMQAYCEQLFSASVSAKVSLGNVYYDSGCLNRTVEQEASEAIALEKAQTQLEGGNSVNVSESPAGPGSDNADGSAEEYITVQVSESESPSHGYAVANGDLSQIRTAASSEGSSSSNEYEEQSSAVIYDYTTADSASSGGASSGSGKRNWKSLNDNVVVSPGKTTAASEGTEATTEVTAAAEAAAGTASLSETAASSNVVSDTAAVAETPADTSAADVVVGALDTDFYDNAFSYAAAADSAGSAVYYNGAASNVSDNVVVSPAENAAVASDAADTSAQQRSADNTGSAASSSAASAGSEASVQQEASASGDELLSSSAVSGGGNDSSQSADTVMVTKSYCPGHIDLYVSITIKGINDKNNSLFKADPIGNNKDNFTDEWQGWTDDKIALAKALCEQDWLENYGLSISSIKVTNSLTTEEINSYLNSLSPDISQERRDIVEFALNSVGKVPYYWGGKPSGAGYEPNHFYTLISADYRGRILKGLDCSGWINWVYWSVTGHSLAGESTGTLIGCGRRIQRSELKPGDIIIRTGADAHVVMFLCWAQNGNFIGIHETGGVINNVVVAEMTASWPYYRSLID